MAHERVRLHLTTVRSGNGYHLSEEKPAAQMSITQTLDLADRSDADRALPGDFDSWNGIESIVDRNLNTTNGLEFISDRFDRETEVSGLFSGQIDFIPNKKDFDFNVQLYELTPSGEYVQLSYYWTRASYARDRSHRQLLLPGKRQQLDFQTSLLTSRQFSPGSRLVVVLSLIKRSDMQINYGTGKEVSDETIADAKEPLKIEWFGDSFIDVPVRR
jgi:predicted acyl esterase